MNKPITLISHHLCPYVQRAAIALTEKGVPFERVLIDLNDKPDWFKALSPLGKVPLLQIGDDVIFESAAILEYLEDTQPGPLHPTDALMRARHRAWIEFGSSILADIWVFETTADADTFAKRAGILGDKFQRIEQELGEGPWFAGQDFSLVDAVFGPIFRYFDVFDTIGDFGVFTDKPKVQAWRSRLAPRPSVRDAVATDYPDRLRDFLLARPSHIAGLMTGARQAA